MSDTIQRDPEVGDGSEPEVEALVEKEDNEEALGIKLLKVIVGVSSKSKAYVSTYSGYLNPEELIDWINAMDKYFDYEEIPEEKKVKFAMTRLKGHASLW